MNGYNPIIPNELQKYFHDKRIENSYIKKLSILLYNNDKNYEKKRSIINNLSCSIDSNNKEYLTKLKFNFNPISNNSNINEKTNGRAIENNNINKNHQINFDINYYREPKVIINNEKIMMKFFKKRSRFFEKLPYLSRSTNDLINYNYKRSKDKENINNNWMSSNNNYLNIIPKIRKIYLKRINFSSKRNYSNDLKTLKIKSFSTPVNERNIYKNRLKFQLGNQKLENKEIKKYDYLTYENNSIDNNKLSHEEIENLNEKFEQLKNLSNKDVIKKIENEIDLSGVDLPKDIFPNLIKGKKEFNLDLKFGQHI